MKRKMMMIKCACLALSQCKVCLFSHPPNLLSLLTTCERPESNRIDSIYNIFYLYQAGGKVGWNSKGLLTFFLSFLSSYICEQDLCHLIYFLLSAALSKSPNIDSIWSSMFYDCRKEKKKRFLYAFTLLETINKIKSRKFFIKFLHIYLTPPRSFR